MSDKRSKNNQYCSVPNCTVNKKERPEVAFFSLPKNPERAELWLKQVCLPNTQHAVYICEEHFEKPLVNKINESKRRLDSLAVPTLNLPQWKTTETSMPYSTIKHQATMEKQHDELSETFATANIDENSITLLETETVPDKAKGKTEINEQHAQTKACNTIEKRNNNENIKSPPQTCSTSEKLNIVENTLTAPQISTDTAATGKRKFDQNTTDFISTTKKLKTYENPMLTPGKIVNICEVPHERILFTSARPYYGQKEAQTQTDIKPLIASKKSKDDDDCNRKLNEMQNRMRAMATSRNAYLQLSMKFYLKFPKAYKIIRDLLFLPKVSELKDVFKETAISLEKDTLFAKLLKQKIFNSMTSKQKQCFVSIIEIKVKPRVYYDITKDHLLGIYDLNGIVKPEPATTAIVMIVQGIFDDWKQPVAVGYVIKNTPITSWVAKNIELLMELGYAVHALVYDINPSHFHPPKDNIMFVNKEEIHCINEISSLIKSFYYNFSKYDYSFNQAIAKKQHIVDYVNIDSKKEIPLTPKITEKHIKCDEQTLDIENVMEVFSTRTAAAILAYTDSGLLDESARQTVELLTRIRKLYDILNAGKSDDKWIRGKPILNSKGFAGEDFEKNFINEMIKTFRDFKFILEKREVPAPKASIITNRLNVLLKTVLTLSYELKRKKINDFPIWRLNLDAARLFVKQVQKHSKSITNPTAKNVDSIFRQLAIIHLVKPYSKDIAPIDLKSILLEYEYIITDFKMLYDKYHGSCCNVDTENVKRADYNVLNMDGKDGIVFVSAFLLKKCIDSHACDKFKKYNSSTLNNAEILTMCESIMKDNQNCAVPSMEFIEFVEMMELLFRTFMNKEVLPTLNKKIILSLLKNMESINVPKPCPCFPAQYVKKLYIRFRLYHTLKYNNDLFRTKRHKLLVVNNL